MSDERKGVKYLSIYIAGDPHGIYQNFVKIDSVLHDEDICIICGDCGLLYYNNESEQHFLSDLQKKKYKILFVDGNHENFDALYQIPEEDWCGGKVHKLRDNVIHLCRGYVYTIEGKKFFAFGGGYSLDKDSRVPHVSWWEQEMPSQSEYDIGKANLEKNNWTVDYIITHTTNKETINLLAAKNRYSQIKQNIPEEAFLNYYLEDIREFTNYKQWFFGHFHVDENIDYTRQVAVYEKIIKLT